MVRRRGGRKRALGTRAPMLVPHAINQRWSLDFVSDTLSDGRRFRIVVIETVGVGQSETDVADVADTVAVVVQPGSGDVLQFLKAGIMEIPDVLVVTKSDLGKLAQRARRDLLAALRSVGARGTPVSRRLVDPARTGDRRARRRVDAHRAQLDLVSRRLPRAAPTRWPTSPPSTASAACAPSAGGGRR